jgi:hypothetical protein
MMKHGNTNKTDISVKPQRANHVRSLRSSDCSRVTFFRIGLLAALGIFESKRMTTKKHIAGVAAILFLTVIGCAQQPYKPPTTEVLSTPSGNVATLTMINETKTQAFFRTYDNEDCERASNSGLMAILQGGWQLYKNKTVKQTTIRADRPFVFAVDSHAYGIADCEVTGVFVPEGGATYKMEYGEDRAQCRVDVFKVGSDMRQERVSLRQMAKSCRKFGD